MMDDKGTVTLESERLVLRRLTMGDAQEAFDTWTNDPEVTRFLRWEPHGTVGVTEKWLEMCVTQYSKLDTYHWGITLKPMGRLFGTIGTLPNCEEPDRPGFGYCIAKEFWGKGYTTEALKRIIEYLKNEVGYRKFVCNHAKQNPASGAVMKHAGFKYVGDTSYKSFDGKREYEAMYYHLNVE